MTAPLKDGYVAMPRSKNAVQPATPAPFKRYVVPQPMLDAMERCRLARTVGKSWKSEGEK